MAGTLIKISVPDVELSGELHLEPGDLGLTLFAHGSGSSRHSPRNQYVARVLREAKIGTLLFDLMTPEEEQSEAFTRHLRFDIPFLAQRLEAATRWALDHVSTRDLNIGYFGSSTGAAAAIMAAAEIGQPVSAIVSRGGRPDLAGDALERVISPSLFIVGGDDTSVIPLNEEAYDRLRCPKALRIVPGASHLFEEPGALELVAKMAAEWFADHLQPMVQR
jgi:putative phosphoribosyl transferase